MKNLQSCEQPPGFDSHRNANFCGFNLKKSSLLRVLFKLYFRGQYWFLTLLGYIIFGTFFLVFPADMFLPFLNLYNHITLKVIQFVSSCFVFRFLSFPDLQDAYQVVHAWW